MLDHIKARMAKLLLAELRPETPEAWYYLTMVLEGQGFFGGWFIRAHGPVQAWDIVDHLHGVLRDSQTLTHGPFSDEVMTKIPDEQRWRRLTLAEATELSRVLPDPPSGF
jgi:hypothetical protein